MNRPEQANTGSARLAAVALGSNLPGVQASREANLLAAVRALGTLGTVLAVSRFIDTAPVGTVDQPRFLNGAALLRTGLAPVELLDALLRIELQLGRDRSHGIDKGPRTLDLDLLLVGDAILQTPKLTLPHPEMHRRRFVLEPLAAIAPDFMHPVLHRSMRDLLGSLPPA